MSSGRQQTTPAAFAQLSKPGDADNYISRITPNPLAPVAAQLSKPGDADNYISRITPNPLAPAAVQLSKPGDAGNYVGRVTPNPLAPAEENNVQLSEPCEPALDVSLDELYI